MNEHITQSRSLKLTPLETEKYSCRRRYSKDVHGTKCQELTIVWLTHSLHNNKARIRCHTTTFFPSLSSLLYSLISSPLSSLLYSLLSVFSSPLLPSSRMGWDFRGGPPPLARVSSSQDHLQQDHRDQICEDA